MGGLAACCGLFFIFEMDVQIKKICAEDTTTEKMRMEKGRTVSEVKRKTREACVEGLAFRPKPEARDFLFICEVFAVTWGLLNSQSLDRKIAHKIVLSIV